jgi:hypothetical protein
VKGRVVRAVTIMFTAAVLLTGCVVSPPLPTPPPTTTRAPESSTAPASPGPTTAPVADPVDPIVTHITVRPEQLDLLDSAGLVVTELSYDADAAVFVDAVSTALGGPPSVKEWPGGHEWFASTRYTWPGVEVSDDHEPSGVTSDMNVNIRFTHPVVGNGITVSTVQGFRPGDDLEAFAGVLGEDWTATEYHEFPAETGPDVGERGYDSWTNTSWRYANANAVSVSSWGGPAADATVTSVIFAPWNFGIGHV